MPTVRHTVGFPPELGEGPPPVRLPLPFFLVISYEDDGYFLERMTRDGELCGDTQAEYEFSDQIGTWRSVPDGEDPLELIARSGESLEG